MSSFLSFIGWGILPNYATSFLQNLYYGITIRAGEPRPQPPSPVFARHRRRIFIFVITSYLLYTLYETFHQVRVAGDFYQALGVAPLADERTIKQRFRRLAMQHHPDKVNRGESYSTSTTVNNGDEFFVYLKLAQDTLLDPAKRFAYDRFGPDMFAWSGENKTMQDYLFAALQASIPQYVGGFVSIVCLNFFWWGDWGRYWRFYTFAALLTLEIALVTHPMALFMPLAWLPSKLQSLIGASSSAAAPSTFYLLPFQILQLVRRASVTLHIFISQLAPRGVAKTPNAAGATAGQLSPQTIQQLGQTVQLSRATDAEATRLLQLSLAPFRGDQESVTTLRKGMREGLELSGIRSSPDVQKAVAQVVERKQRESHGKTD